MKKTKSKTKIYNYNNVNEIDFSTFDIDYLIEATGVVKSVKNSKKIKLIGKL